MQSLRPGNFAPGAHTMRHRSAPTIHRQISKLAAVVWTLPSRRYLSYIRSPQWMARRREHLAENPKCQICFWRVAIQVHHWSYVRLGNERPEDLCSICLDCHHKIHCKAIPVAANDNQLQLPLDLPA